RGRDRDDRERLAGLIGGAGAVVGGEGAGGGRHRCVFGGLPGVGVGGGGVVDLGDGDADGAGGGHRVGGAVGGPIVANGVAEAGRAVVIGVRRVGDRTVRVKDDRAV